MWFVIGQLFAAGVLAGLVHVPNEWAYRVPFTLQWVWPALIFPVLLFAPESPWHLLRHGRLEEADKSIRRLERKSAPVDPLDTLANIVHTNSLEKQMTFGTSYLDCFRSTELRLLASLSLVRSSRAQRLRTTRPTSSRKLASIPTPHTS